MSAGRILLVDPDLESLQGYGELLRGKGFDVDATPDGQRALRLFEEHTYQVVLVDMLMPGVGGLELIDALRQRQPQQPILALSVRDDVDLAVKAMKRGVHEYLVKPVEREALVLAVRRVVERDASAVPSVEPLPADLHPEELRELFRQGLQILESLDAETVSERLLGTLCDACGAQTAALWLAREDHDDLELHAFRGLVDVEALPSTLTLEALPLAPTLIEGRPALADGHQRNATAHPEPAPALWCGLVHNQKLMGVVALARKLRGGFGGLDLSRVRLVAECAGIALGHAHRYTQLERVGLRDPVTSAYSMSYFVDYLGRELHKARRYQRGFALIEIALDNLSTFKHRHTGDAFASMLQHMVRAVSSVMRDTDILARVSEEQMFALLPETDLLGALRVTRRVRRALLANPFLEAIDRQHPIVVTMGPAAFPRDGDDIDQLFAAGRRRIDESRKSAFRRLQLDGFDFWGAVDLVIGSPELYASDRIQLPKGLPALEDAGRRTQYVLFERGLLDSVRCEVVDEALRQPRSGLLFLAGRWSGRWTDRVRRRLENGRSNDVWVWLVGDGPPRMGNDSRVASFHTDDFNDHELVLALSEYATYGLVAKRRSDGSLYGFHSSDWTLVEGLVHKLQLAYPLQRRGRRGAGA